MNRFLRWAMWPMGLFLSLYFRHSRGNVCRRVHYRTMAAKRRWIHEAFFVWSGSQVFQSWPKLPHGKNCQSTSVGSCSFQVCLILQGMKDMLFVKCLRIMILYIVHLCLCNHYKVKIWYFKLIFFPFNKLILFHMKRYLYNK